MKSSLKSIARIMVLFAVVGAMFSLIAVPDAIAQPKRIIGVSVLTLTNPFFKEMADSIKDEAKKYNYDVIVLSGDLDPAKQRNQIRDFVARKVDAIILNPCDSRAVGSAIREANRVGIPVFTADIANLDAGAKVVSHIATNNYEGGRQAAKAMVMALGGKKKPEVAIIGHPEVESVILREKGFRDELKDSKSDIVIVGSWPGFGDKAKSFAVAQEILQAYPNLKGFFCINDPSALGAYAAVEIAKKKGQITIVGFDGQPEGRKAIKDGKIFADAIQFPQKIGRVSVQSIMKYFNGEEVQPEVLIPTKLYFKADADKDPKLMVENKR